MTSWQINREISTILSTRLEKTGFLIRIRMPPITGQRLQSRYSSHSVLNCVRCIGALREASFDQCCCRHLHLSMMGRPECVKIFGCLKRGTEKKIAAMDRVIFFPYGTCIYFEDRKIKVVIFSKMSVNILPLYNFMHPLLRHQNIIDSNR